MWLGDNKIYFPGKVNSLGLVCNDFQMSFITLAADRFLLLIGAALTNLTNQFYPYFPITIPELSSNQKFGTKVKDYNIGLP